MLNGRPFVLPPHVRTALLNFDEPELYAVFENRPTQIAENISREFLSNDWTLESGRGDTVLLRKDRPGGPKLVQVLPAILPVKVRSEMDPHMALADLETRVSCSPQNECLLEMQLDWLSLAGGQKSRAVRLDIVQGDKVVASTEHIPGYMVYPPVLWKQNEVVREHFIFPLPSIPPGEYDLRVGLVSVIFLHWGDHPQEAPLEAPMRKVGSIHVR